MHLGCVKRPLGSDPICLLQARSARHLHEQSNLSSASIRSARNLQRIVKSLLGLGLGLSQLPQSVSPRSRCVSAPSSPPRHRSTLLGFDLPSSASVKPISAPQFAPPQFGTAPSSPICSSFEPDLFLLRARSAPLRPRFAPTRLNLLYLGLKSALSRLDLICLGLDLFRLDLIRSVSASTCSASA